MPGTLKQQIEETRKLVAEAKAATLLARQDVARSREIIAKTVSLLEALNEDPLRRILTDYRRTR
jgi:hypothetical protein